MAEAIFFFEGNLNHFLPKQKKRVSFTHIFKDKVSIKDMIESLGVPHPEVNAILVNDVEVNFSYSVQNGDRIWVYPPKFSFQPQKPLIPELPGIPRFVLDVHLGKLAGDLRLLGFDTLYRNDYADEELAIISDSEKRILLTRDRGVLMRSLVSWGYYVRSTNPKTQIQEVGDRFNLFNQSQAFSRCIRCNGLLEPIAKELIIEQIPEQIKTEVDKFSHCLKCSQIYWQGSHFNKLEQFVVKFKAEQARPDRQHPS